MNNAIDRVSKFHFIPRAREIGPQFGHYVDHSDIVLGIVQH